MAYVTSGSDSKEGRFEMISVQVFLFSTIRALIGQKELVVELPKGATVRDLKKEIGSRFPLADQAVMTMLTSVNRVFSDDDKELEDQAEVAFFPHVSGG
jgi:molybdopterin converting factor small subunit